jgi:hypothetical protein
VVGEAGTVGLNGVTGRELAALLRAELSKGFDAVRASTVSAESGGANWGEVGLALVLSAGRTPSSC